MRLNPLVLQGYTGRKAERGTTLITTKGRYALRVMIDLAEHRNDGYIPLKDVAERQGISKKYLEILAKDLVAGKLILAVSGRGGGYVLTREPDQYPIGEILERMEGSLASVSCLSGGDNVCPRASVCPTLPLWEEYDKMIRDFFYGKTLADLLKPVRKD